MNDDEITQLFIAPIRMTAENVMKVKLYCIEHGLRIPELTLICLLRQVGCTDEEIKSVRSKCYPFQPKGRRPRIVKQDKVEQETSHESEQSGDGENPSV